MRKSVFVYGIAGFLILIVTFERINHHYLKDFLFNDRESHQTQVMLFATLRFSLNKMYKNVIL